LLMKKLFLKRRERILIPIVVGSQNR